MVAEPKAWECIHLAMGLGRILASCVDFLEAEEHSLCWTHPCSLNFMQNSRTQLPRLHVQAFRPCSPCSTYHTVQQLLRPLAHSSLQVLAPALHITSRYTSISLFCTGRDNPHFRLRQAWKLTAVCVCADRRWRQVRPCQGRHQPLR